MATKFKVAVSEVYPWVRERENPGKFNHLFVWDGSNHSKHSSYKATMWCILKCNCASVVKHNSEFPYPEFASCECIERLLWDSGIQCAVMWRSVWAGHIRHVSMCVHLLAVDHSMVLWRWRWCLNLNVFREVAIQNILVEADVIICVHVYLSLPRHNVVLVDF